VIKSSRTRWAGRVACMGEVRNAYIILVGKPDGKRPLGESRRRWKDNNRKNFRDIKWECVD